MNDDRELTPDEALRLFTAASQVPRHVVGVHLDDEDLLALAEGSMTEGRLAEAMRHVESCAACAEAAGQTMDALGVDDRASVEPTRAVATPLRPATASVAPVGARSWTRPSRTSWMGMAATLILTLTAGGYAGVQWRRAAAETESIRRTLDQRDSRVRDLETQLAQAQSRQAAAETVVGFSLRSSDTTRATNDPNPLQLLPVPPGAAFVTLLVDVGPNPGSPADRYEVVVTNPDLPQDWRSVVRPEPRDGRYIVAATAPRSLLPDGDYLLVVEATSGSGQRREVASTAFMPGPLAPLSLNREAGPIIRGLPLRLARDRQLCRSQRGTRRHGRAALHVAVEPLDELRRSAVVDLPQRGNDTGGPRVHESSGEPDHALAE